MTLRGIVITLAFGLLLGCAGAQQGRRTSLAPSTGADDQAVWESAKVAVAPGIDGEVDAAWSRAKAREVVVREALGGGNPITVTLRSVHTDDNLYVLAEWEDVTKSDMRDPFVWNKEKSQYDRPTRPDDQFALQFPLSGDFDISMLSMQKAFISDVWHWKAGRGNVAGWADDKRHIISQTEVEGAKRYDMGGHGAVYILRPVDAGTPAYKVQEPPKEYVGNLLDSFVAQVPKGSLADVRAKGVHNGKGWTLEMARAFNTGNADDATIDKSRDNTCAIAVLNDELYWDHSVSQTIRLRFLK